MNRRSCKAKEYGARERSTYGGKHVAKHITVTLVYDYDYTLLIYAIYLVTVLRTWHYAAHLLNRSNDEPILCVRAIKFTY